MKIFLKSAVFISEFNHFYHLPGANYVVEASDVLNKLSDAKLHLKSSQKGYRIRHIVEVEERKKIERGRIPSTF